MRTTLHHVQDKLYYCQFVFLIHAMYHILFQSILYNLVQEILGDRC